MRHVHGLRAAVVTNNREYATWNPADKNAGVTLSNGNLTATTSLSSYYGVRANQSKNSGKHVFEVTHSAGDVGVGWCDSAFGLSARLGAGAKSAGLEIGGSHRANGFVSTGASPPGGTGTFMFAVDLDAGKAWVGKGGSWYSGDPAAGTTPAFTWAGGTTVFPVCVSFYNTSGATANFGASAFSMSVPAGFNSGWFA